MAKALVQVERSELDKFIADLENVMPSAKTALDDGARAWGSAAKSQIQKSYLSGVNGATVGDYIYRSISFFGEATGAVKESERGENGVWINAGVYKIDSIYSSYNAAYQAKQKGSKKRKALTAAQLAYWTENGTSRLYVNGRAVRKSSPAAKASMLGLQDFDGKLVEQRPQPFLTNALVTGATTMDNAFMDAFSEKMQELL